MSDSNDPQLTFLSEGLPVKPSQSQDIEKDWKTKEGRSQSPSAKLLNYQKQDGLFGKTSPESCQVKIMPLDASSLDCLVLMMRYAPPPWLDSWPSAGVVSGPKYGLAWRVLDAQFFGIPQSRKRIFVVGYLGDWRPAAKAIFETAQPRQIGEDEIQKRTGNRVQAWFDLRMSDSTRRDIQSRILIRELTALEYERAQGFPDQYTNITYKEKDASWRLRKRACGNSMAVPVMRWIGERIALVEASS